MSKESKKDSHVEKLRVTLQMTHVLKELEYRDREGIEWVGFYAIPTEREDEFKKNPGLFLTDLDSDTLRLLEKSEFTKQEIREKEAAEEKFQRLYNPQSLSR